MANRFESLLKPVSKAAGFVLAWAMGVLMIRLLDEGMPLIEAWLQVPPPGRWGRKASACFGFLLNAVLHLPIDMLCVAGRALFGGLAGCRFLSYRWMWFALTKERGRLRLRRKYPYKTALILCAPSEYSPFIPVVSLMFGGHVIRLLVVCAAACFAFTPRASYLSWALAWWVFLLQSVSLFSELRRNGKVMLEIERDEEAHYEFWRKLRIAELHERGMSLRQMPDELFSGDEAGGRFPAPDELQFLRAFERMDFDSAREISEDLDPDGIEDEGTKTAVMYDLLFLELTGENRKEHVERLNDDNMLGRLGGNDQLISSQRTHYAVSRLCCYGRDCGEYIRRFEQCAKRWECADEVAIERELIEYAYDCASARGLTPD